MKEALRKLKLIDSLVTELTIEKSVFIANFKKQVDIEEIGMFSDIFDVFSSSKSEYKGIVEQESFEIKRRRRFFDMNMQSAIAKGTYIQEGEKLIVETEISGFHGIMIFFFAMLIPFYAIFFLSFLATGLFGSSEVFFVLPFIVFHGLFMCGIPYFMMRRSVKKTKHDLEREFFYSTKQ